LVGLFVLKETNPNIMKSRLLKVLFLAIYFLITSCQENVKYVGVPPSPFQDYIDRFVDEAKKRGITISVSNLTVKFGTVYNYCGYGEPNPPRVSIDKKCWDSYPDIAKEILMFHELGHAILARSHDDSRLGNGDYVTLMNTGDISMLYNEYTPGKRMYYLDELFNVLKGLPDWTKAKTNETLLFYDEINDASIGNWVYQISGVASQTGSVTDNVYYSPFKSLMISSSPSASGFSYWVRSWKPTDIEEGADLILKVRIKGLGLTGKGAFFAFRANVSEKEYPIFFYTTQLTNPVIGTTDFTEYSLKVTYFPSRADQLHIFLLLDGNNQGQVYFDDVQLVKYN
jgi:hypothetical protein